MYKLKFKAATYCHASSLIYLHSIDELQADGFISLEFEITNV